MCFSLTARMGKRPPIQTSGQRRSGCAEHSDASTGEVGRYFKDVERCGFGIKPDS